MKIPLFGRNILISIVAICVIAGLAIRIEIEDRDNIAIIRDLPKIVRSHGQIISIEFTGQQRTIVIKDGASIQAFQAAVLGSSMGVNAPENQFYAYRILMKFGDGYLLDLNGSVSNQHILLENNKNDDNLIARTVSIPPDQQLPIWVAVRELSSFSKPK